MGRKEDREREDLVDAMGEASRAWGAALDAHVKEPTKATAKALEAAREASADATRAYHVAKLAGKEAAAVERASKAGA